MTILDDLLGRAPKEILQAPTQRSIDVDALPKTKFKEAVREGRLPPRWKRSGRKPFMAVLADCYRKRDEPRQREEAAKRQSWREERALIMATAHHDVGVGSNPSPGEVDARTGSKLLNVEPGGVICDPKLRPGYTDPSFRPR